MKNQHIFYTTSDTNNSLINQIKIDEKSQKYVLSLNADENITYEYDVFGQEIYSTYVSRRVFDLILDGVKSKGYKKLDENDDFRKN